MAGEDEQVAGQNNAAIIPAPVAEQLPPLRLVKHLRKYDGTSDSSEFISRIKGDFAQHNVSSQWIVHNFDRVLEGQAGKWFTSVYPLFNRRANIPGADYDIIWEDLQSDFLKFFDHSTMVNEHKRTNRSLIFKIGDDPQSYVTDKLEVLRFIDPFMSDERKVENLVRGLPVSLQVQMVASATNSPRVFIEQLRRISEVFNKNRIHSSKIFSQATASFYSAPMLAETQTTQRRDSNNKSRPAANNQPNHSQTVYCPYCHRHPYNPAHPCYNRIRDEASGIYQDSRPLPSQSEQSPTVYHNSQQSSNNNHSGRGGFRNQRGYNNSGRNANQGSRDQNQGQNSQDARGYSQNNSNNNSSQQPRWTPQNNNENWRARNQPNSNSNQPAPNPQPNNGQQMNSLQHPLEGMNADGLRSLFFEQNPQSEN